MMVLMTNRGQENAIDLYLCEGATSYLIISFLYPDMLQCNRKHVEMLSPITVSVARIQI